MAYACGVFEGACVRLFQGNCIEDYIERVTDICHEACVVVTDPSYGINYISNYSSRRSLVHDEDTMIWDVFTFIGTVTCFGVRQLEIASPRVTFILS